MRSVCVRGGGAEAFESVARFRLVGGQSNGMWDDKRSDDELKSNCQSIESIEVAMAGRIENPTAAAAAVTKGFTLAPIKQSAMHAESDFNDYKVD